MKSSCVFISYDTETGEGYAENLYYALKKNKSLLFCALKNIKAGENLHINIDKAINECSYFVLIGTRGTLNSNEVKREVKLAKSLNKKIIACKYKSLDRTNFSDVLGINMSERQINFENKSELANAVLLEIDFAEDMTDESINNIDLKKLDKEDIRWLYHSKGLCAVVVETTKLINIMLPYEKQKNNFIKRRIVEQLVQSIKYRSDTLRRAGSYSKTFNNKVVQLSLDIQKAFHEDDFANLKETLLKFHDVLNIRLDKFFKEARL